MHLIPFHVTTIFKVKLFGGMFIFLWFKHFLVIRFLMTYNLVCNILANNDNPLWLLICLDALLVHACLEGVEVFIWSFLKEAPCHNRDA